MPTVELEELCYARYEAARDEEASIEHQRELVKRLLQKTPGERAHRRNAVLSGRNDE